MPPIRRSGLTPAYQWDDRSQRYINTASKRFVSRDQVRAALDIALDRSKNEVARLSRELVNGRIGLADWQLNLSRELKNMHLASASLAKGGWAQMTQADFGRVGQRVRGEYVALARFGEQIKSGEQPFDGRFFDRLRQYTNAPRATYHAFEERGMSGAGRTEYKNILAAGEHCKGPNSCLEQTDRDWQPIGTLVPIGQRRCLNGCKCRFVYR